jgi:hypothetical protein
MILPVPVKLNRLAAARRVFSFDIESSNEKRTTAPYDAREGVL